MAKDLALILNNGSLNSAVTTALAAQKFRPILLYADVPSAPLPRNRAAYDLQVAHFKPYREHTLGMPFLALTQVGGIVGGGAVGGGGISASSADPLAVDPRSTGNLAPQLVGLLPLLAAAAQLAAHYQASALYFGLRVGPQPDELAQATEYVQVLAELLQLPCRLPELEVVAPLLELEAWQVVDVGVQVGAPLDRTWSCLDQAQDPCGSCRGCRARAAAFEQAVKPDPMRPGVGRKG